MTLSRPPYLSRTKAATGSTPVSGFYHATVVRVERSKVSTFSADAILGSAEVGEGFFRADAVLGSKRENLRSADVYVLIPRLSADFEYGPIDYLGDIPSLGDSIYVTFKEGRRDELIALTGGGGTLEGAADVVLTSIGDEDVLSYDLAEGVWKNIALASITGNYLPLAGGTMTGDILFDAPATDTGMKLEYDEAGNFGGLGWYSTSGGVQYATVMADADTGVLSLSGTEISAQSDLFTGKIHTGGTAFTVEPWSLSTIELGDYGAVGTQGDFALDIAWNWERDTGSAYTAKAVNSYADAANIRLGSTGILFGFDSTWGGTAVPTTRLTLSDTLATLGVDLQAGSATFAIKDSGGDIRLQVNATYTQLYNPAGDSRIWVGADDNYYNANTHHFRSSASVEFATLTNTSFIHRTNGTAGEFIALQGGNTQSQLVIEDDNPQMYFRETGRTTGGKAYWLHHNDGVFYILGDFSATGSPTDGGWDSNRPFRIDSLANVIMGNDVSVGGDLTVTGDAAIDVYLRFNGSQTATDYMSFDNTNSKFRWYINNSNTMTLQLNSSTDKRLGINDDTPDAAFDCDVSIALVGQYASGSTSATGTIVEFRSDWSVANQTQLLIQGDGDVYNRNGTYSTISDVRYKDKDTIYDARDYSDDLRLIRPQKYKLSALDDEHLGYVAQDVQVHKPGFVKEFEDVTYERELVEDGSGFRYKVGEDGERIKTSVTSLGVKTSLFIPMLHSGWLAHDDRITSLEQQVATLTIELAALKAGT